MNKIIFLLFVLFCTNVHSQNIFLDNYVTDYQVDSMVVYAIDDLGIELSKKTKYVGGVTYLKTGVDIWYNAVVLDESTLMPSFITVFYYSLMEEDKRYGRLVRITYQLFGVSVK